MEGEEKYQNQQQEKKVWYNLGEGEGGCINQMDKFRKQSIHLEYIAIVDMWEDQSKIIY